MNKVALVGFLTVIALLGLSRPSGAAVTASLMMVGPNPLTTTCPVNVNFTGSITGPAGPVTYAFGRFVNGSFTSSAPITGTIPTSGTLPISVALNIDKAHSGFQSEEVDVSAPSATQGKVYFTVNCQSGSGSGSSVQLMLAPPAPTGVLATRDVDVCAAHINRLFCKAAIEHADQPLVWDWSGNPSFPTLDGYKVYRVDRGHNDLIETTSAGDGIHGTFIGAMGLANGRCYVVTGYVGTFESRRSAQACVSP